MSHLVKTISRILIRTRKERCKGGKWWVMLAEWKASRVEAVEGSKVSQVTISGQIVFSLIGQSPQEEDKRGEWETWSNSSVKVESGDSFLRLHCCPVSPLTGFISLRLRSGKRNVQNRCTTALRFQSCKVSQTSCGKTVSRDTSVLFLKSLVAVDIYIWTLNVPNRFRKTTETLKHVWEFLWCFFRRFSQ